MTLLHEWLVKDLPRGFAKVEVNGKPLAENAEFARQYLRPDGTVDGPCSFEVARNKVSDHQQVLRELHDTGRIPEAQLEAYGEEIDSLARLVELAHRGDEYQQEGVLTRHEKFVLEDQMQFLDDSAIRAFEGKTGLRVADRLNELEQQHEATDSYTASDKSACRRDPETGELTSRRVQEIANGAPSSRTCDAPADTATPTTSEPPASAASERAGTSERGPIGTEYEKAYVPGSFQDLSLEQIMAEKGRRYENGKSLGLTRGHSGTGVEDLQRRLKLDPTGTYDDQTAEAVTAFQEKHKLRKDGVAGYETISTLSALAREEAKAKQEKQRTESKPPAQCEAEKNEAAAPTKERTDAEGGAKEASPRRPPRRLVPTRSQSVHTKPQGASGPRSQSAEKPPAEDLPNGRESPKESLERRFGAPTMDDLEKKVFAAFEKPNVPASQADLSSFYGRGTPNEILAIEKKLHLDEEAFSKRVAGIGSVSTGWTSEFQHALKRARKERSTEVLSDPELSQLMTSLKAMDGGWMTPDDEEGVMDRLLGLSDGSLARLAEKMDLPALVEGTIEAASPAGQLVLNRIHEAQKRTGRKS